jgi:hypothetical protein
MKITYRRVSFHKMREKTFKQQKVDKKKNEAIFKDDGRDEKIQKMKKRNL